MPSFGNSQKYTISSDLPKKCKKFRLISSNIRSLPKNFNLVKEQITTS